MSTIRNRMLALLACTGTFAGGAAVAVATESEVAVVGRTGYGAAPVVAVDGAVWTLSSTLTAYRRAQAGERTVVVRGADGHAAVARSPLVPLTDGGVAVVYTVETPAAGGRVRVHDAVFARVTPDARTVRRVSLPQSARRSRAFAIAGDGTVWWQRGCADALYRRLPDGQVDRFALPRRGCGGEPADELGSGLALGPDGAVWYANSCQGRVARLGVDGRRRTWRTRASYCGFASPDSDGEESGPTVIAVDPRGGIAFQEQRLSDWHPGGRGGRITPSGTYDASFPTSPEGFFSADGTYWGAADGQLGVRSTGSAIASPAGLAPALWMSPAPGGRAWLTAGVQQLRRGSQSRDPVLESWITQPTVGLVSPNGRARIWPLTPLLGAADEHWNAGDPFTRGDGALSIWVGSTAGSGGLLRIAPTGQPSAPPARATVVRLLARDGRTVWLQLACGTVVGRWCSGTVRLTGTAAPVRFAVAGEQRAAVRLTLSARAARTLRRRGVVKTTAVVRSVGAGQTRRTLTLRR